MLFWSFTYLDLELVKDTRGGCCICFGVGECILRIMDKYKI
jgi:hypothetical protein